MLRIDRLWMTEHPPYLKNSRKALATFNDWIDNATLDCLDYD
jgi:hypothetical protein